MSVLFQFAYYFSGEINEPVIVPGAMTFPNKKSMINVNMKCIPNIIFIKYNIIPQTIMHR